MSCCDPDKFVVGSYEPLHKRLSDYGKDVYGVFTMEQFPNTSIWIYSFIQPGGSCMACTDMLTIMNDWFTKYSFFSDIKNHVKWVIEDDTENNLIWRDLGLSNLPTHLFCDSNGKILDIYSGFPNVEWLDDNVLNWIRNSNE